MYLTFCEVLRIVKWSEIKCEGLHRGIDENLRAVLGYLLTTLGIDLENIPRILFEKHEQYKLIPRNGINVKWELRKVYLSDIVGTSYQGYGGKSVLESFLVLKRAPLYIKQNCVTRGKYHHMMKRVMSIPIRLTELPCGGKYVVTHNGNHRVILYKLMMLAEIAQNYEWSCSDTYDLSYFGFCDIRKKYWMMAEVEVAGANEVILCDAENDEVSSLLRQE